MLIPVNLLRPNSPASRYFDLLRGLAALYVMLFHLRPQLYEESAASHSIAVKGIYLFTSLGYQLVMAFFVLSGYLMTASILKAIHTNQWSWRLYLSNRLLRLWIVLVPALALTYLWAALATSYFETDGMYEHSLNWESFWGNLFFLQQIQVPNYGVNVPLWSLSYEFWYYVLFPCVILIYFSTGRWKKIAYLLAALAIGFFVGMTIVAYFAVWLLGSLLAVVPLAKVASKPARALLLGGSLMLVAAMLLLDKMSDPYSSMDGLQSFPLSFGVGLAFAILLYFLLSFYNVSKRVTPFRRGKGFSKWLARISYPLYLTHWPVLLFLNYAVGYQSWEPDMPHLLYGAGIAAGLVLYAWLVACVTEAQLPRIKDRLFKRKPLPGDKPQGSNSLQGKPNVTPKGGV